MANPSKRTYRELPVTVFNDWDNAWLVRNALADLERGMFRSASYLVDAMGRDDRISGVMTSRVSGLQSLPLEFKSAGETKRALAATELVKEHWDEMAPAPELAQLHEWGVMLGYGLAQKIWDTQDGIWVPRLQLWHPSFLYWRWDTFSLWVITADGLVEVPKGGDENWFLYAPYGYYRGWMHGKVRAIALPWLMRAWARRDWARYNEVYGLGLIKAKIPAQASQSDGSKDRFVDNLANRGSEPVIECEQDENGKGFDFDIVEAKSTGYLTFPQQIGDVDAAIAIALIGQNLTTEGGRGGGGAFALGKVHYEVKQEITKSDNATWGPTLQAQLLRPFCKFNIGDEHLAPLPDRQVDPPADKAQEADALDKLSTAVKTFADAGAPVDVRELLDEQGVPLISPEEEAKRKTEQDAKAKADADAKAAALEKMPKPPAPGQQPQQLPPAGPPEKLDAREREVLTAGAKQGQVYVDALTERAAVAGEQALHVDLAAVLRAVHDSKSFADLRERLVVLVGEHDDKALAALVEKAQIMAELAGRKAVLEDL